MKAIELGLKKNLKQFILLVIINAFVGGMVGLERSILPKIAEQEFNIAATTAAMSFIMVFGLVKAWTNYFTGALANKFGRKNLLIAGWIFGLPVPFILMGADSWNWIVAANILLGINQGLAWSSTVVMKIDLVGEKNRGLAMGLNEFAGYMALALVAFLTGWLAGEYGLRPYPFYTGIFLSVSGLLLSWLFVQDTVHHVSAEAAESTLPRLKNTFWETTVFNKNLSAVTQGGLINNLNDGMAWGLIPILLSHHYFSIHQIGIVAAIYPAVWGLGQIITGTIADRVCKKSLLTWGMLIQGLALLIFVYAESLTHYILLSIILGWGTAMVYPTFLASIAENTHPFDRAQSLGVFRLWRDLGYAMGALLTGIIADSFGINSSIVVIGLLTVFSSLIISRRMSSNTNAPRLFEWLFKRKRYTAR